MIPISSQKCIAGIEVRTKNSDEMSGNGKISGLWDQFFNNQISEKVGPKISDDIYVVYSNYESDHNGEYDYLIGFEIKPENISHMEQTGIQVKKIEPGSYTQITTEKGPFPKVLVDAWQKIWAMDSKDFGGARLFKTDFEVYSEKARDPQNSIVDIYLGVKSE